METHKIWPKKEDMFSDLLPPSVQELFDDDTPNVFYLPGKRPNEISPEKWEEMVDSNPLYKNDDLPIAISKLGEVVCLERPKTALSICICGIRQTGKSISLYSLADQMKWHWGSKIGFMNEGLGICFDHVHKNQSPFFRKKMNILNLQPQGMPLVFCYPSSQDVTMAGIKPEYKISIPWKEFFREPEKFSELGKSGKYLSDIKEDLIQCRNIDDIKEVFKNSQMPESSKVSLFATINELVNHQIFDIVGGGLSKFTLQKTKKGELKKYELHPLIALMKSGLMPCLMTARLSGSKYEEQVFKFYLWMVWHAKEQGGPLRDEPVVLFIDELNQVQGKNSEILVKLLREGANMGVGGISTIWCAQNYSEINQAIRTNTTMGILFKQDDEEARALKKRYNLTNYWMDRLKTLEKFECLLVTEDKFKIYNPLSGEYYYTKEPILAEILPPLSMHRKELSPQDDYLSEQRRYNIHARILREKSWVLKDEEGKRLFDYNKLTTSGIKTERKKKAIYEKRHVTERKLNIHPLTIYEGQDIKSMYFKKRAQPTEELSYQELLRKGLRIISAPAPVITEEKMYIRVVYVLWPTNTPIPLSARLIESAPSNVNILYNSDFNGVLICGTNCYSFENKRLSGTSDWVSFDKKWLEKYCQFIRKILK